MKIKRKKFHQTETVLLKINFFLFSENIKAEFMFENDAFQLLKSIENWIALFIDKIMSFYILKKEEISENLN